MRSIKFRVWHNGQMFYDCALNAQGEIMQFTGLVDRGGKEIWEGDILTGKDSDNEYWPEKYDEEKDEYYPCGRFEVYWSEICWWLKENGKPVEWDWWYHDGVEIEVLGNIYENPELLK